MNAVRETLEAMEAELHQEVYRDLQGIRSQVVYDGLAEDEYIDVRLQVTGEGDWTLHVGDASYDQDHSGFWGAGTVSPSDDDLALIETARDLVEQVLESVAQMES